MIDKPTPEEVKNARIKAGFTQQEAADRFQRASPAGWPGSNGRGCQPTGVWRTIGGPGPGRPPLIPPPVVDG